MKVARQRRSFSQMCQIFIFDSSKSFAPDLFSKWFETERSIIEFTDDYYYVCYYIARYSVSKTQSRQNTSNVSDKSRMLIATSVSYNKPVRFEIVGHNSSYMNNKEMDPREANFMVEGDKTEFTEGGFTFTLHVKIDEIIILTL